MFEERAHTIWAEKYRPTTLENYIGNEAMKEKFEVFIQTQDVPHLLLVGPAGTGKTTAAKILMSSIDCDTLSINASDENNIETVRSKIRSFASTQGFAGFKIALLDEFDGFTRQGQEALRNLMEQFSLTTRFILTANYGERVIPQIISRTQQFHVVPPSNKEVCLHLAGILQQESISFKPKDVKSLVDAFFPDIRKILNEAQSASRDGQLTTDEKTLLESDFKLKMLDVLTQSGKTDKRLVALRQIIADSNLRDFAPVYRFLYDRIDEYAPEQISSVILAIADGQYHDSLVPDKEINLMATFTNILKALE